MTRRQSVTTTTEALVDPPKPSVRSIGMPPGPSGLPLVGQAFRLRFGLIRLLQEAATYGDVSTVSVNPILIYLVNHPDLNRQILVTDHSKTGRGATAFETVRWMMGDGLVASTGAFHLKQRRLMQPRFHRRYIEHYAAAMTEISSRKSRQWQDGARVDMEQEMRELTLQIVAKALFDLETHDVVRRVGESFAETDKYMYLRLTQPPFLRRFLHSLPIPSTQRFKAARAYLDELIYGLIRERRQSGAEGDDLLCMLLQVRYEDAESEEDGGMSDELVRDEAVSLYVAEHDTTATTLAYAFYLLCRSPEVEKRFHAELDDVLGDRDATLDDLPNLPLTNQIVTETLRLYPPFWALGRMVYEPIELGGYDVPPGVAVMIAPLITHRDPRWFDDPLEFRPERWTDEFRSELPPFAYFPFGGGPHRCIGEGFAWMEATIALATLCRRWRAAARGKAEIVPRITIKVKGGMPMTLERRR
ncbi:MAG: cytochrome P450 [Gammaproteobacteria bacterium]|nr:cytochrome P450 [Gammaproteobacteria bacterium]MDE0248948.1 cytochrome P450 [Gammaproteobacteria bacterium]